MGNRPWDPVLSLSAVGLSGVREAEVREYASLLEFVDLHLEGCFTLVRLRFFD